MKFISERDTIKAAIPNFIKNYDNKPGSYDKDNSKCNALKKLNPDTCTKDEVNDIIGNVSWTTRLCGDCDNYCSDVFEVGQNPDYDSRTAYLCFSCVAKLSKLAREHQGE